MSEQVEQSEASKVDRFHIDSVYVRRDGYDAVVVKELLRKKIDGVYRYKKQMRVIHSPQTSFWLTKPQFRTYDRLREAESLDRLDQYVVPNYDLFNSIANKLQYRGRGKSVKSFNSPYLYGADVDIQARIKMDYIRKLPVGAMAPISHGTLDIENRVTGKKEIILISFIHEQTIYLGMLKEYMYEGRGDNRRQVSKEYIDDTVKKSLHDFFDMHGARLKNGPLKRFAHKFNENDEIPFEYRSFAADTELDLIKWIFRCIHAEKTDAIGIWNIDYDIPHILTRIEELGGDVLSIISSPDVPKDLRRVFYKCDNVVNKQKAHITDRWHQFISTCWSNFYCAMATYARVRKASGREVFYSLEYIANKVLGVGKNKFNKVLDECIYKDVYALDEYGALSLLVSREQLEKGGYTFVNGKHIYDVHEIGLPVVDENGNTVISQEHINNGLYDSDYTRLMNAEDTHDEMQRFRYPEYAAYCVCDTLLPQLMAWINNDYGTVNGLIGAANWWDFDKQSAMLRNVFFQAFKANGKIIGTANESMESEFDAKMGKAGGTVLSSANVMNVGLFSVTEFPIESLVHIYVSDIDAGSMYPTCAEIANISRETKISTVIGIDGCNVNDIEAVFNCIASPVENICIVGESVFNLPSYTEMVVLADLAFRE